MSTEKPQGTTQEPIPVGSSEIVGRRFPIMQMADPWHELPEQENAIPWEIIAPHEAQAQRNHSQSLQRLAERGGLSPCEAVAVIEDEDYRKRWPYNILTAEQMVKHNTTAILRLRELCANAPSNARSETPERKP